MAGWTGPRDRAQQLAGAFPSPSPGACCLQLLYNVPNRVGQAGSVLRATLSPLLGPICSLVPLHLKSPSISLCQNPPPTPAAALL